MFRRIGMLSESGKDMGDPFNDDGACTRDHVCVLRRRVVAEKLVLVEGCVLIPVAF